MILPIAALGLFAGLFMIGYALITRFPFYVLFVYTFVSTKESTSLHLWIPCKERFSSPAALA